MTMQASDPYESIPKRVIATWIYLDRPDEESNFPQVGSRSSSQTFQKVYWRCVLTFFITSKVFNPNDRHILYTNSADLPDYSDFSVSLTLKRLGVEIIQVPLTFKVPRGYWGSWNNQFYIFDILKFMAARSDFDSFVLLDSDCVWINSANEMLSHIENCGLLAYDLRHEMAEGFVMNGLSLEEMSKIYSELGFLELEAQYYGGEFFGATRERIVELVGRADDAYRIQLDRQVEGKKKFNEEAQLLSYLYQTGPNFCDDGERYIARIWSHIRRHRHPTGFSDDLIVLHMPVEKKHGVPRLLKTLLDRRLDDLTPDFVRGAVKNCFGLPKRGFMKDFQDISDKMEEYLQLFYKTRS